MKKIIILLFILTFTFINNICNFKLDNKEFEDNIEVNNDNYIEEVIEDEPIEEIMDDNYIFIENISNDNDFVSKTNIQSNNNTNTNVIEEYKQEEQIEETIEIVSETKEENIWDTLGISEDDYYHKPMWSWARIDYSIEDYVTLEQAHQACIDAGNELEHILSFSCTNINSYSGDYLGDMLRVKY